MSALRTHCCTRAPTRASAGSVIPPWRVSSYQAGLCYNRGQRVLYIYQECLFVKVTRSFVFVLRQKEEAFPSIEYCMEMVNQTIQIQTFKDCCQIIFVGNVFYLYESKCNMTANIR